MGEYIFILYVSSFVTGIIKYNNQLYLIELI